MPRILAKLRAAGFDVSVTYHADAILHQDFPAAMRELEDIIGGLSIPIEELIRGGGGEAKVTQRTRRLLHDHGWRKGVFRVEKKINDQTTFAQSHEVDHVKRFENGTIALEIEWNNKDPFFDRDLENFHRLHADGAISIGVILTRGASLQSGIGNTIREFAAARGIASYEQLRGFGVRPTERQIRTVENLMQSGTRSFEEAWAAAFTSDKFGGATTHWTKLKARLDRGVGSPCPIVAIGIPLSCIANRGDHS